MSAVRNPFLDYLTRYTTASPDHEAAFDEFLAQTPPPTGQPLHLPTRVEEFLRARFLQPEPPSVILTGNAGDGKTYLCRKILAAFGVQADWNALADTPVTRGDLHLHVVKDLSELGVKRGVDLINNLAESWRGGSSDRYLIAANEGRLRDLLGKAASPELYQEIDQQLQRGADVGSPRLVVINLTRVTTSSFVPATLRWMTADEHWTACVSCPILNRCPVRRNARRLSEPQVSTRVQLLYQLLEHLDIHITVRDMLIHLAYTVSADRRCPELQRLDTRHADLSSLAYYANIWGGAEGSAFRRKASVVQHLERLQIGAHSLFKIDDFIVSGGESEAETVEHERLFAPAVDLNFKRFGQDRTAYIEGGAERRAGEEARALLTWLPHCRRKLFFEWEDEPRVYQLIAFRHLETYLRLLADDWTAHEHVRRNLVLGLNRAFSHLYLTDDTTLFVTSQSLHSAEQSRPLVRLAIPSGAVALRVDRRAEQAFDRAWPELYLLIGAPPELLLHDPTAAARPQSWRLNLLLFEYLMRLAEGGTYNILAEECELSVRNLKERLLSAYAQKVNGSDVVEFFVAERRRYSLKKLRFDERGSIRGEG